MRTKHVFVFGTVLFLTFSCQSNKQWYLGEWTLPGSSDVAFTLTKSTMIEPSDMEGQEDMVYSVVYREDEKTGNVRVEIPDMKNWDDYLHFTLEGNKANHTMIRKTGDGNSLYEFVQKAAPKETAKLTKPSKTLKRMERKYLYQDWVSETGLTLTNRLEPSYYLSGTRDFRVEEIESDGKNAMALIAADERILDIISDIRFDKNEGTLVLVDEEGNLTKFYNKQSVKSLTIPDGITEIPEGGFSKCPSLESVVIPESVTRIGEHAFSRCNSLKSIVIPESVTSIGAWAFNDSPSLLFSGKYASQDGKMLIKDGRLIVYCGTDSNPIIPESVTTIGVAAFAFSPTLQSIVIPNSVEMIDNQAFQGCSLLESVVMPESVKWIREYVFTGCTSLKSIRFPDSLVSIWDGTFKACKALSSVEVSATTNIGNKAFEENTTIIRRIPSWIYGVWSVTTPYGTETMELKENGDVVDIMSGHIDYGTFTLSDFEIKVKYQKSGGLVVSIPVDVSNRRLEYGDGYYWHKKGAVIPF